VSLGSGFPASGQPGCRSLQARAGRVGCGSLPAIHLFWQGQVILISKPVSFSYMLRRFPASGTRTRIRSAPTCYLPRLAEAPQEATNRGGPHFFMVSKKSPSVADEHPDRASCPAASLLSAWAGGVRGCSSPSTTPTAFATRASLPFFDPQLQPKFVSSQLNAGGRSCARDSIPERHYFAVS